MEENPVFTQYVLKHCDINEVRARGGSLGRLRLRRVLRLWIFTACFFYISLHVRGWDSVHLFLVGRC